MNKKLSKVLQKCLCLVDHPNVGLCSVVPG